MFHVLRPSAHFVARIRPSYQLLISCILQLKNNFNILKILFTNALFSKPIYSREVGQVYYQDQVRRGPFNSQGVHRAELGESKPKERGEERLVNGWLGALGNRRSYEGSIQQQQHSAAGAAETHQRTVRRRQYYYLDMQQAEFN